MDTIKDKVTSLLDRLAQRTSSTCLETGEIKHEVLVGNFYPEWLRDIFAIFGVAYGKSFTDRFIDPASGKAVKKIWYDFFSLYELDVLGAAIPRVLTECKFAPCIAEVKPILDEEKRQRAHVDWVKSYRPKAVAGDRVMYTLSSSAVEAKISMYRKLGLTELVTRYESELSAMADEEVGIDATHPALV